MGECALTIWFINLGHYRAISWPLCDEYTVLINACDGICPSSFGILFNNLTKSVDFVQRETSCSIVTTHDVSTVDGGRNGWQFLSTRLNGSSQKDEPFRPDEMAHVFSALDEMAHPKNTSHFVRTKWLMALVFFKRRQVLHHMTEKWWMKTRIKGNERKTSAVSALHFI